MKKSNIALKPYLDTIIGYCDSLSNEELIHIVDDRWLTIPPLRPGERKTLRFGESLIKAPRILHPSTKGIIILDARYNKDDESIRLHVRVCREQGLQISNTKKGARYQITVEAEETCEVHSEVRGITDATINVDAGYFIPFIRIQVRGDENHFVEKNIIIKPMD